MKAPLRKAAAHRLVPTALLVSALCAVTESGAASKLANATCQCRKDPIASLVEGLQTRLQPREKQPKRYPPPSAVPRRFGATKVTATLYNVHTREALPVFVGDLPPSQSLAELLRCRGFGTRQDIDPRLIQTAVEAAAHFKVRRVDVVSAFRSEKFNDFLAKKGRNVASESRHIRGEAMDFRLLGVSAKDLGRWLEGRFEGGLGIYPSDNFVHIDVGPKRRWRSR